LSWRCCRGWSRRQALVVLFPEHSGGGVWSSRTKHAERERIMLELFFLRSLLNQREWSLEY
jgi:hypothetical protein